MKISVELTLTPLHDDYEPVIQSFIEDLRNSGCKLIETPLSTQIYGNYDLVMDVIRDNTKKVFENTQNVILNSKIISHDRSDYSPDF